MLRGCLAGYLDSCVLADMGRGEFPSPLRRRGDHRVRRSIDQQRAAHFKSGGFVAARGCGMGARRGLAALSRKSSPGRGGLSFRRTLSTVGSAAFTFSRRDANPASLGAAPDRLRQARLGAAMRDRAPAFHRRTIRGPSGKYQLRVHRPFCPPPVGTGADSRADQLALYGVRGLFADAFGAEENFPRASSARVVKR